MGRSATPNPVEQTDSPHGSAEQPIVPLILSAPPTPSHNAAVDELVPTAHIGIAPEAVETERESVQARSARVVTGSTEFISGGSLNAERREGENA